MSLFNNSVKPVHVNRQCEHFILKAELEARLCALQLHDYFTYKTHPKNVDFPKSTVTFCTFVKIVMFIYCKYSRNIIVII